MPEAKKRGRPKKTAANRDNYFQAYPPEVKERCRALWSQGKSLRYIASNAGVSYPTIQRWRDEMDWHGTTPRIVGPGTAGTVPIPTLVPCGLEQTLQKLQDVIDIKTQQLADTAVFQDAEMLARVVKGFAQSLALIDAVRQRVLGSKSEQVASFDDLIANDVDRLVDSITNPVLLEKVIKIKGLKKNEQSHSVPDGSAEHN